MSNFRPNAARPTSTNAAGVTTYQCTRCVEWHTAGHFAPLANPESRCRLKSWCKRCEEIQRREARQAAKEGIALVRRKRRPRREPSEKERDARFKDRLLSMGLLKVNR